VSLVIDSEWSQIPQAAVSLLEAAALAFTVSRCPQSRTTAAVS